MKRKLSLILVLVSFMISLNYNIKITYADEKIYLGGYPAGFSLYTRGAHVVGVCDVITEDGLKSPSKEAEMQVGDIILAIGEYEINSAADIDKSLSNGKIKNITLNRNGEIICEKIIPVKDVNGKYKLGVFIKENISGIGTITYVKGDTFASLGHPVANNDGKLLQIKGGELFDCSITGCIKGKRGEAGELRGVLTNGYKIATVTKNNQCGVFGVVDKKHFDTKKMMQIELGAASIGEADIYTTLNGNVPSKYKISIIKIDNSLENKNFVVKICDNELIDATGGIVQGMSGSPIVQDDKLVGAITHVFINDPTRGFGISIDKMINIL